LLTASQTDVLRLLAEGRPNKEIARYLRLSEGAVRVHVNAILKALNVRNRTQAALAARSVGL
jgi:DNA-binding NarL/FixJ family response regulator